MSLFNAHSNLAVALKFIPKPKYVKSKTFTIATYIIN